MGNSFRNSNPTHEPADATSKRSIWPALAIALGLHALIVLLPFSRQAPGTSPAPAQIEIRLTAHDSRPAIEEIIIPRPEPSPEPASSKTSPEPRPVEQKPARTVAETSPATVLKPITRDYERMNAEEKARLTHTILRSQFITEESAAEQVFGKQTLLPGDEQRKEFHFPDRPDLVAMLDQPMQELPFDYTPGLVHFAYDPGIKGDLQRFWDVITPEFGWTTDNGTEVRCAWVLIVAACGWK